MTSCQQGFVLQNFSIFFLPLTSDGIRNMLQSGSRVYSKKTKSADQLGDHLIDVIRRGSLLPVQELLSQGVNPNYLCPASGKTCLEVASEGHNTNAANIVTALLSAGADGTSARPMILAAKSCNFDTLATLLRHSRPTDTGMTTIKGMTLLHHLCMISCHTQKLPQLIACLNLALDFDDAPVNRSDALGMTPIMHAVERYYEDRVYAIIMHKKHRVNLDFVLPMTGNTARKELLKRFGELADYLPPPLVENLDCADVHYKLLGALHHRRLDIFKDLLERRGIVDPNYWYDEPYSSTCLTLACRIRGSQDFVKALLDAGADPKYERCNVKSFLTHVVCTCNYMTLKALLDSGRVSVAEEASHGISVLHMAVMQRQARTEDSEETLKCVKLILDEQKKAWDSGQRDRTLQIDYREMNGNTALHFASIFGNKGAILLLLRNGASVLKRNCKGQQALDVIPADVFKNYLDELIDCNRFSPKNGFDSIIFNYDFLFHQEFIGKDEEGTFDREIETRQSEIQMLMNLTKPKHRHLILHPVIFSYLLLKWQRVKFLFALNFMYNCLFVVSLNIYIISSNPNKVATGEDNQNNHAEIKTFKKILGNGSVHYDNDSVPYNSWSISSGNHLSMWICAFLFKMVMEEIVKIREHGLSWLKTFRCILSLCLPTLTIIMIAVNGRWNSGFRHLSAMVTLLSWILIILQAGMLPSYSIQLKMFEKVAKTFFRFMAGYSLIIVAFALCFHCMFRGSDLDEFFENPGLSILRTITMFAGEFSLSSLAFNDVPITSHIVFILFVLLIAVVLLNLLNGLAVHDTHAIKEKAAELSAAHLMILIATFERFLLFVKSSKFCHVLRIDRVSRDPRIWLSSKQRRRVFVFPDEDGVVKFYMDPVNTERYKKFRFPQEVVNNATLIMNSRDEMGNMDAMRKHCRETTDKIVDIVDTCRELKNELSDIRRGLVVNQSFSKSVH